MLCVDDGWGERRLSLRTGNGQVTVTAWTFYRNGSGLRKTLADIDAEDHLVLVADNLTEYTFVNVQVWLLRKLIILKRKSSSKQKGY